VAQAKAYLIKGGLALNLQRAVNWVLFLKRKRKKRGRKLSIFYLFFRWFLYYISLPILNVVESETIIYDKL
jgi:hypothetical protein